MDQVTVLEISRNVVEVAVLGPRGPQGIQGIQGPPGTTTWSGITGKPTTVAGFGITDAENTANKGAANGYAGLDGSGKVPSAQLPSYVDDVLEFANLAAFSATGETGKIYVALDTNFEYRWSGSTYIRLVSSPGSTDALAEGTTNLYFTAARVLASVLTGLSTATNAVITASDTVLSALGKLQKQITDLTATVAGKAASGANSDITSITGMSTPLSVAQGGTSGGTQSAARTGLGLTAAATMATSTSGTFTPALNFGGASTGITYNTQTGTYVRVGPLVFVQIRLILTSKGTATGSATITGLPFSAATDAQVIDIANASNMSGYVPSFSYVSNGSTTLNLSYSTTTGTGALSDVNFTNTSVIILSGVYNMGSLT